MVRRKRRDKISLKKYLTPKNIIISVALAVVVTTAIVLISAQSSIYIAKKDTISFTYNTHGVIIRNEKLYKTDVSSRTKLVTEEGTSVSAGDIIAEVYTADYNKSIVDELNSCEKKILDYLRNNLLKDVLNQDLNLIDEQIEEVSDEIRNCIVSGDTSSLTDLYTELCTIMQQRRDFLKEQVNEDAQLIALYNREDELLMQIESWTKYSVAEEEGIVSYYFDGAEASLTPSNMKELTADELLNIQNGKSYYTLASSANAVPLYRLVKTDGWYVAVVSDENIDEFRESQNAFTIDFTAGKSDELLTAKVADIKEDGGKYIYYFRFDSFNKNLLTPRYVEMNVSCDYVGTIVPKKALKTVDGIQGIYIKNGKNKKFVEVNVLILKDGMACVEPVDISMNFGEECEVYV